jgi:phage terminase large subunit
MVDKTGTKLNKPIDAYNHAIDAIRYLALNKLSSLSDWMDFE